MSMPTSPAPGTPQSPTKAVIAAVLAGLTAFVSSVQGKAEMHPVDWIIVVLSAIIAGLAVWVVPNQAR